MTPDGAPIQFPLVAGGVSGSPLWPRMSQADHLDGDPLVWLMPISDSYSTIFQYESLRITFPLRNE
jgi:hypothetical protein